MTLEEQELVIRLARDETMVTATGTGAYWTRYLQRLATRLGVAGEPLSPEVFRVRFPLDRLRLLTVKRHLRLTDADRARRRQRFTASHTDSANATNEIATEGTD
jgi:hypothetical protein